MIGHYFSIALRNLRRSPFTALVNVVTLALGLVAFVAAYAVVAYWGNSDRHCNTRPIGDRGSDYFIASSGTTQYHSALSWGLQLR